MYFSKNGYHSDYNNTRPDRSELRVNMKTQNGEVNEMYIRTYLVLRCPYLLTYSVVP